MFYTFYINAVLMVNTCQITEKLSAELDLLERHILMLKITKENQPIGIIRLSELLKMPKHKVRYSLRLLEQSGLIEPSSGGAKVTDRYDEWMNETEMYLSELMKHISSVKDAIPRT